MLDLSAHLARRSVTVRPARLLVAALGICVSWSANGRSAGSRAWNARARPWREGLATGRARESAVAIRVIPA